MLVASASAGGLSPWDQKGAAMAHTHGRRGRRVLTMVLTASLATSFLVAVHAAPAAAAGIPSFEMPFPCGEVWQGSTYKYKDGVLTGHPSGYNAAKTSYALDFNKGSGAADRGLPVVASAAGTVSISASWGAVYIDHGAGWVTRYGHMEEIYPAEDDWVEQGDPIGKVGDVGAAGAYHLHYDQSLNGIYVPITFDGDPVDYSGWNEAATLRTGVWKGNGPSFTSDNCGGGFADGTWLRMTDGYNGSYKYFVVGGAKFYITQDEFDAIDWTKWVPPVPPVLVDVESSDISGLRDTPRDGTLIRDPRIPQLAWIYEVIGGAKYKFPDEATYMQFMAAAERPADSWTNVPPSVVASDKISGTIPAGERTTKNLLRDPLTEYIYEVRENAQTHELEKVRLTAAEWNRRGSPSYIDAPLAFFRDIPDGVPSWSTFAYAPDDGTRGPGYYVVAGGTKFWFPRAEWEAIGSPEYLVLETGVLDQLTDGVPTSPIFLRDYTYTTIYQVYGGARYDAGISGYQQAGSPPLINAPASLLAHYTSEVPADGSLVKAQGLDTIYQIVDGKRVPLVQDEYNALVAQHRGAYGELLPGFIDQIPLDLSQGLFFVTTNGVSIHQVLDGQQAALTQPEYDNLGAPDYITLSETVFRQLTTGVPGVAPGELVKSPVANPVYRVDNGEKSQLTPLEYDALGRPEPTLWAQAFLNRLYDPVPAEGTVYVRDDDGHRFQVIDGHVALLTDDEYSALGSPATLLASPAALEGLDTTHPAVAVDDLLKSPTELAVYRVFDGHLYPLSQSRYNDLTNKSYSVWAAGFLGQFEEPEDLQEVTFVKGSGDAVYQMIDGKLGQLTQLEYAAFGNPAFTQLSDATIEDIPTTLVGGSPEADSAPRVRSFLKMPTSGNIYRYVDGTLVKVEQAEYNAANDKFFTSMPLTFLQSIDPSFEGAYDAIPAEGLAYVVGDDAVRFQVIDGHRAPLIAAEYAALGNPALLHGSPEDLASLDTTPPTVAVDQLLKSPTELTKYQVFDGERFPFAEARYNALTVKSYSVWAQAFLNQLPVHPVPQTATFVKGSSNAIYQKIDGKLGQLTYDEYVAFGYPAFTTLPDATIDPMPTTLVGGDPEADSAPPVLSLLKLPTSGNIYRYVDGTLVQLNQTEYNAANDKFYTTMTLTFFRSIDPSFPGT